MREIRELKKRLFGHLKDFKERIFYDYSGVGYLREYLRSRNRPNAVFIWIPKTAGTSLWSILDAPKLKNLRRVKCRFTGRGIVTFGHMDYSQLVKRGYIPRLFDDSAYKFAFVRNPYARTVSLYSYLKQIRILPADESFLTFCRGLKENGCEPIGLYNTHGLSQCNPQVRWIENTEMSYIGKVESINNDAELVLRNLGLPNIGIPQLNVTDHPDFRGFYCSELKEIVEEFYAEDFRSFDYEYDEFFESHII